jgi:hypothetical protein
LFDFSADRDPFGVGLMAFRAILWSVPQVVIALVGDLITWGIFGVGGASSHAGIIGERSSHKVIQRSPLRGAADLGR